jgi:hypothetical protein
MDFDDCSIKGKSQKVPSNVRSIYEQAVSQKVPRIFANNLLFLVADEEQKALRRPSPSSTSPSANW